MTVFPIATNPAVTELTVGIASDGTNYLVGLLVGTNLAGQLVSHAGQPIGAQLPIGGKLGFPPAAALAFGATNYLMVWSDSSVSSGVDMFGQLISTGGAKVGSRFQLLQSQGAHGFQTVTGLSSDGTNFLAVWQDSKDKSLYGQWISPAGALGGAEFLINNQPGNGSSAVAFGKDNYLVAWISNNGAGDNNQTYGEFVSPNGAVGRPFQISATASYDKNPLALAFDGSSFFVIWPFDTAPQGSIVTNWSLHGRLVSPTGMLPGNELAVVQGPRSAAFPSLASDGAHFLLGWSGFSYNDDLSFNPTNSGVYFQFFKPSGDPVGSEFTVFTPQGPNTPLVVFRGLLFDGGRFAVAGSLGTVVTGSGHVAGLAGFPSGIVEGGFIATGVPLGNIVVNGGFETGDFSGWTLAGSSGGAFVDDGSSSGIAPRSGTDSAVLGASGGLATLSQTLTTVPTQSYTLSLWLNSPDGATPNEFLVSWNGHTVFDQMDLPAIGWTNLQFTITAAGTSSALVFGFRDDNGFLGLDDVNVQAAAPVPTLSFAVTPAKGPPPLLVQFSCPGVDSTGASILSWKWQFGDGSASALQNPSHTYSTAGTFSPSLIATNDQGLMVVGLGPSISVAQQTFTNLHDFTHGMDGGNARGGLRVSGPSLYGTTPIGGAWGLGALFKVGTDGTGFATVYSFSPLNGVPYTNNDGVFSDAGLTLSGNTLYGTANQGGQSGQGTVFAVANNGAGFANLHNFTATFTNSVGAYTNSDGARPEAGLLLAGNTLYGTAEQGGKLGRGAVFRVNIDGTGFTNLHDFVPFTDGEMPLAGLVLAGNILYGVANTGGSYGSGTVFALNTDGTGFTTLHHFQYGQGSQPWGTLVLSGGVLYGTTVSGGASGSGTVFKLNTDGTAFTVLYSFSALNDGANSDGAGPSAGLVLAGSTLYGTTYSGGGSGNGTVFAINTDGSGFTNPYSFSALPAPHEGTNSDGANPDAGLVMSGDSLYGTTSFGGAFGYGTVFALSVSKPLLPPTLSLPAHFPDGQFQLTVNGTSDQYYKIQMSTMLPGTNWIPLLVTNAAAGSFSFRDSNATNQQRFYRVVVGP